MHQFIDTNTGLAAGYTNFAPLSLTLPSPGEIASAAAPLVLSASGWRKIFAESGDEEDRSPSIGDANRVIAAHMAGEFADWLIARESPAARESSGTREIAVALDTRPTGFDIADIMCRVFAGKGFRVRYAFIAAAPEIMAYAKEVGAFAYVSASHNPIGHNGVKFGLDSGGVLSADEIKPIIASLKASLAREDAGPRARGLVAACPESEMARILSGIDAEKKRAIESYRAFSLEVISGERDIAAQRSFFGSLERASASARSGGHPVSIVADFNGSARAASIDRALFSSVGVSLFAINDIPGRIAHRIVPEGASLSYCAAELERLRREGTTAEERNALLGYVPDCDGDRGNIVYWNDAAKKAETLEAQEVFALSVVAELAHLAYLGHIRVTPGNPRRGAGCEPKVAVAVNDPTSMRIEAIACAFGAKVARAEVGEANTVNLARRLREDGYIVRILGEGSNGGNITHPAAVRDPLNTVFALLKLLVITDDGDRKGLFRLWCDFSGQEEKYRARFTLSDVIATLPKYATTSVYESEAMLSIASSDHASLKRAFQRVFAREWDKRRDELGKRFGIASWTAISNNGVTETVGVGDFGVSGMGGLKILFSDAKGDAVSFIWMRGSGTERVFRILADARGDDVSAERYLLSWLTDMVLEADRQIR
jgi:phosphoglucomutase